MNKMFTSLSNETSNFDNQLRVSVTSVKIQIKSQIEGLGIFLRFYTHHYAIWWYRTIPVLSMV